MIDIKIKWLAKGQEFINKFDKKYKEGNVSKTFLEEEIVEFTEKEAGNILVKILHTSSLKMKNAYSSLKHK